MHPGWDEFLEKVKLQLAGTFLQERDEKKQKEKYVQINTPSYLYCRVQRDEKKKKNTFRRVHVKRFSSDC